MAYEQMQFSCSYLCFKRLCDSSALEARRLFGIFQQRMSLNDQSLGVSSGDCDHSSRILSDSVLICLIEVKRGGSSDPSAFMMQGTLSISLNASQPSLASISFDQSFIMASSCCFQLILMLSTSKLSSLSLLKTVKVVLIRMTSAFGLITNLTLSMRQLSPELNMCLPLRWHFSRTNAWVSMSISVAL